MVRQGSCSPVPQIALAPALSALDRAPATGKSGQERESSPQARGSNSGLIPKRTRAALRSISSFGHPIFSPPLFQGSFALRREIVIAATPRAPFAVCLRARTAALSSVDSPVDRFSQLLSLQFLEFFEIYDIFHRQRSESKYLHLEPHIDRPLIGLGALKTLRAPSVHRSISTGPARRLGNLPEAL